MRLSVPVYVSVVVACFGAAPSDARKIPPGMHPVKPVSSGSSSPAADLRIDSKAITVMVGNAGFDVSYTMRGVASRGSVKYPRHQ